MKYGFDLHGVLDTIPETLLPLMEALVKDGHEVHIITGIPFQYVGKQLERINCKADVHFTNYFSIQEYLEEKNTPILDIQHGRKIFGSDVWNTAKAEYCKHNNINLMIDDSISYSKEFKTPFCLFNLNDR